jgi:hypothetical protein
VLVGPAHRQLQRAAGLEAGRARIGVHRGFRLRSRLEDSRPFTLEKGDLAHGDASSAHSSVSGNASTPSASGKRSPHGSCGTTRDICIRLSGIGRLARLSKRIKPATALSSWPLDKRGALHWAATCAALRSCLRFLTLGLLAFALKTIPTCGLTAHRKQKDKASRRFFHLPHQIIVGAA